MNVLNKENKANAIYYIGKTGTLRAECEPNQIIATGSRGYVGGRLVTWQNVFQDYVQDSSRVVQGDHITVTSPLEETDVWRQSCDAKAPPVYWVDCEVGHMASTCKGLDVSFGYLHIVSDNVLRNLPYNLANESLAEVQLDRWKLFAEINKILMSYFNQAPENGESSLT